MVIIQSIVKIIESRARHASVGCNINTKSHDPNTTQIRNMARTRESLTKKVGVIEILKRSL